MGAGRKGKYEEWLTEDGLELLEGLARHIPKDKELARQMGICPQTLSDWKKEFPELNEAIKKGRAPIPYRVEKQFIKSCEGFIVKLKKPMKIKEEKSVPGKGKIVTERIEYVEEEIYIAPNVTAQIFYLKNHMPDVYKDRREEVITASVVDQATIDEIEGFMNGIECGEETASDTAKN